MRMWQVILTVLALLAVASSLTVGPVDLVNSNRFINFTRGASPHNSLLFCRYHLDGEEEVTQVSWQFKGVGGDEGDYVWKASGGGTASGHLVNVVNLDRDDGTLELTELRYDLSGNYSCRVALSNGETEAAAPWEVLIVDSVSQLSTLHTTITGCSYTSSYSTLAMFPEPAVRAGMYSAATGDFYSEIPKSEWSIRRHENGSVTYSYSNVTFQLDSRMPVDISFYVVVGVMKKDGNYIPVSSATDSNLILHHLGCPEPRLEEYQQIRYHRDSITCRGEHKDTEATVSCKEGYHADGPMKEVMVKCDEETHKWMLEDGTLARREHLGCVMNQASNGASLSATLFGVTILFLKLSVL